MSDLLPTIFAGFAKRRYKGKRRLIVAGEAGEGLTEYLPRTTLDALLKAERERALREAAGVCTYVIKNYDVMEPGKPDQFASLKTQKAAKGMVSLARQDIEALISEEKTDD